MIKAKDNKKKEKSNLRIAEHITVQAGKRNRYKRELIYAQFSSTLISKTVMQNESGNLKYSLYLHIL